MEPHIAPNYNLVQHESKTWQDRTQELSVGACVPLVGTFGTHARPFSPSFGAQALPVFLEDWLGTLPAGTPEQHIGALVDSVRALTPSMLNKLLPLLHMIIVTGQ